MDAKSRQAIREMLRKRFKGKRRIYSKVKIRYKENLEREYKRIIDTYYAILIECILPTIKAVLASPMANNGSQNVFHTDDRRSDFIAYIKRAFGKAGEEFARRSTEFGLAEKINKLGEMTERLSAREWKRVVQKTLGINLLDDYYSGEFYREQLQLWSVENADLISSLPTDCLNEMQQIIEDGFLKGSAHREIIEEIQSRFNVSRNKARFYAVDQMAKLNAAITKQQQTECGIQEYEWSSSGDQRVRESHRKLNGTIQRWDTPPVVDEKTGRRAHPGEDYRCRCVALPIFDFETLDIPVDVSAK